MHNRWAIVCDVCEHEQTVRNEDVTPHGWLVVGTNGGEGTFGSSDYRDVCGYGCLLKAGSDLLDLGKDVEVEIRHIPSEDASAW